MKPPALCSKQNYKSSKSDLFMEKVSAETTVWKEIVVPKYENDYFDFEKLNVSIDGFGKKLKEWRLEAKLSQTQLALKLGFKTRSSVVACELGIGGLKIKQLFKIAKISGKLNEINEILSNNSFFVGSSRCHLPLKQSEISSLIHLLRPYSKKSVAVSIKASKKELSQIEKMFGLKIKPYPSARRIHSGVLVQFVDTFYSYKKICKLKFPLTNEVLKLVKEGVDLRKAVILPLLQSDGCASLKKGFEFNGKCKHMHNLFVDAMFYQYEIFPSGYFFDSDKDGTFKTFYVPNKKIHFDLISLGGAFKSCPCLGQEVNNFLKQKQPTLEYLFDSKFAEVVFAFRIYTSAEGCICHTGSCPKFSIACANPSLAKGLVKVGNKFGITFNVEKGKTWSGISSVVCCRIKDIERFDEIGGFMEKITVEGNSTYLKGIEKNQVLKTIITHRKEIYKNKKERPSKQVRDLIDSNLSF
jgi:transcriptional regulator with XRE-family HTH domain